MRNLKLIIEYDGRNYCGWQVQDNGLAIQHVLEQTISDVTGDDEIKLIASGRTDAGVHALGQVANFKTNSGIPCEGLKNALNGRLPADIVIRDIEEVSLEFHARYSAKKKHYRYMFMSQKSAALAGKVAQVKYEPKLEKMVEAAEYLLGEHDFKAFMASKSQVKTTVRTIYSAQVSKRELCGYEIFVLDIVGSGFLYNMVRIIAGTLIDIGRGHLDASVFERAYAERERSVLGQTAPEDGLYLMDVSY